ncbi:MAG: ATP-binding protein [Opitutaceae bacterium]|jgi:serine/threonine-protein kinase RsbT
MNENIDWVELARLPIAKMQDVLLARFVSRDEATKMGFAPVILTRLATAVSEITRNVVQHAGCPGKIQIGRVTEGGSVRLRVIISDKGKGIEHPERFMDESKLGAGLPGTRRLVDQFDIQSAPGMGTTVTLEMWKRETTA